MATKAPKPTIRELANRPICPNCGGTVVRRSAKGPMPTFCDAKGKGICKREFENRMIVRGRAVMPLLQAWRIDRGSGETAQEALRQVCQITDQFNAEDNAARRPRADLYAAKLMGATQNEGGSMFMDRQRR